MLLNGVLATRGDGEVGRNVSCLLESGMDNVYNVDGAGEIVLDKWYFNEVLSEEFEHPRSLIVGFSGSAVYSLSRQDYIRAGLSDKQASNLRNRGEMEAEARDQYGTNVQSSVSAKTDILVAGEKAGSKLDKSRKLGSVQILDEHHYAALVSQAA